MNLLVTYLPICFLTIFLTLAASSSSGSTNLEVQDIRFDPVSQGKNKVAVKVHNLTDQPQVFGIDIRSVSSNLGWQSQFFEHLGPGETKQSSFEFGIRAPVTDYTWIRLRFYNPPSEDVFQSDNYFKEERFAGADLEQYKTAPREVADAVKHTFQQFQRALQENSYRKVWDLYSTEVQNRFGGKFSDFEDQIKGRDIEKKMLLGLQAGSVLSTKNTALLKATQDQQDWVIYLVREGNLWKVDDFGPPPGLDVREMLLQQALSTMKKQDTPHFDIYYAKGSTVEQDINQIVPKRESGYQEICKFLERKPDIRIRLIFFEDPEVKLKETGHQGDGWAFGTTIVEVYNKKVQLNPYHEAVHILTRDYGEPPALFDEGLATYMSERLGAPPLKNLGGKESSLYGRVRELKTNGDWIPLEELLTYTEIGSSQSRPSVSYAEAGAFVKFLIEAYGKEKFFEVYKDLGKSEDKVVHQQNQEKLERIYGKSLDMLRQEWYRAMELSDK